MGGKWTTSHRRGVPAKTKPATNNPKSGGSYQRTKATSKPITLPTRHHDADFEPFAVTANDIESLDDLQFRRFMRDLLRNEVLACNSGQTRFIDNPGDGNDQGQDAETDRPTDSSSEDTFIPVGTTVWQYKADRRAPSKTDLQREIAKERPKTVLAAGGNYRFVAQQPRTNESDKDTLLRQIAKEKGYGTEQVAFHAQATLAERARLYPSLAMLPFFRRPLDDVHHFGWLDKQHAATKFDETSRNIELTQLIEFIRSSARPTHVRIVGPAGVGKTRLVLHTLAQLDLGACTVYAPNPSASGFNAFFKWCGEHRARLVLVVDECDEATAMQLRKTVENDNLPVLLVTINKIEDPDIRATDRDLRVHVARMTEDDIVRILDDGTIDKPRIFAIARITGGFVKLARVVAEAVARDRDSVFDLSSLVTVDIIRDAVRSLLGVPDEALRWLGAVALFSEVGIDSAETGSDLAILAKFAGVSVHEARAWTRRALTVQVLSDRGDRIFVTPALLAVLLARDFVRERRHDLPGWLREIPPQLQESFASQLGQLRYAHEGRALARELMAADGAFGDLLLERHSWTRRAFLALGSIAKPEALARLERWLEEVPAAAAELDRDRTLQRLLFRLIWRTEHFARSFRLIVHGLQASPDPARSGLQQVMAGSLRVVHASSQAPFPDRFAVAATAVKDDALRPEVRKLVVRSLALGTGRGGGDGYSTDDIDIDGRDYWHPATYGEWWECTRSVVGLLVELLTDKQPELRQEAAANLIDHAADFIRLGAHVPLLGAISKILEIEPRIGTLREELEQCMAFDKLPDDIDGAVRAAIASLPQDLAARLRVLVEGWPLVRDRETHGLPERPDPAAVADEIMNSAEGTASIALLFEPWAKNTGEILAILAKRPDAPEAWPAVLAGATNKAETWGASLFLATAHDAEIQELQQLPIQLLHSEREYERNLGAETITRMEASGDEVRALIDAVRAARVKPSDLLYATLGRWTERRDAGVVADLIRSAAAREDGRTIALSIAHAAEENLALSDNELVNLLVSTMFHVEGRAAWTWEQVGKLAMSRAPHALGSALIAQIGEQARLLGNRYMIWADEEVARILDRCIRTDHSLAPALLDLWELAPEFVESFGATALLDHVDSRALADWADDVGRQKSLARIVVAAPHPTTEALLDRFGPQSPFATTLRKQLYPTTLSGSLAELLKSRADEVRKWAADQLKSANFREWARASATWLDEAAERAKAYDD